MACLLHIYNAQPTTPKQKGGCQFHWEGRAYADLTFIVSNIVFPNEQAIGAEMLTET